MRSRVARWCAAVAATGMAIMAVLHALWAFGIGWPAASTTVLYVAVTPSGDGTVPGGITMGTASGVVFCLTMAGLLSAAAYVVGARAGLFTRFGPARVFRVVPWVIAAVFLMRGTMEGDPEFGATYIQWNRALYCPLSLTFAALTIAVCLLSSTVTTRPQAIRTSQTPLPQSSTPGSDHVQS